MSTVIDPSLPPSTRLDLDTLNSMFETEHPSKIVEWGIAEFGQDIVLTSSFGAESMVSIHLATRVKPDIRVIMVDTGYLFPETHRFMEQMRQRFNLNVWTYRTQNDPIAYLKAAGETDPTWRHNVDACCAANKNEPMKRAMRELAPAAFLRGIRRNQADTREKASFIAWDRSYQNYAISPILNWGGREIFDYMKQHDLPYHPLVEKGYLSIGCNPQSCTRAITAGEDPRAGRWSGQGKVECGINVGSLDTANQI